MNQRWRSTNIAASCLLFACLLTVTYCSKKGPSGREYDPAVDFGTYRTFAFANDNHRPPVWLEKAVEDSIVRRLKNRGFEPGKPETADLLLSYELSRRLRRLWHRSFNARGVPMFRPETFQSEALLILTLYVRDPKAQKVVWTSYAALPPTNDPEKTLDNLDKVVRRVLRNFPP